MSRFFSALNEAGRTSAAAVSRPRAAGLLIQSRRGRYLLILRSPEVNDPCIWSLPGGGIKDGEMPLQAAERETTEEIGECRLRVTPEPLYVWNDFHTFLARSLEGEFEPELNWESSGYVWEPAAIVLTGRIGSYTVHPGVVRAVRRHWSRT